MPRRRSPIRRDRTLSRLRFLWAGETRVRVLAVAALAGGVGYLTWRLAATFEGAALWLAIPLFLVEIAGFVQLGALASQAWRVPEADADSRGAAGGDVLILTSAGSDPGQVERSRLCSASLVGVGDVVVAPAETASDALRELRAETVLVLAAGEVPPPDALVRAAALLEHADVVGVGLPLEFINEDSLARLFSGRSERELANRVVGPSLGSRGLAPIGPSSFVARRSALVEIAVSGSLPDAPLLGAKLLARGRCLFSAGAPVRTEGPDGLGDYLEGAEHRARSSLRGLPSALHAVGADARQRLALLSGAARYVAGVRAAVAVAVLLGALASGGAPLRASAVALAAVVLPAYVLAGAAFIALGRGTIGLGDRTRHSLRTIGVHCSALVGLARRRASGSDRGLGAVSRLGALTAAVVALDALLLTRGIGAWFDGGLPGFTGEVGVAVIAAGVIALVPMLDVLQLVATRRQDRRAYRQGTDLPGLLDGVAARVRDLTPGGLGLLVAGDAPAVGSTVSAAIDAPSREGGHSRLLVAGTVRSARRLASGETAVGIELDEVSEDTRRSLLGLYWVTLPELADRGGASAPPAASVEAAEPVIVARRGRVALRGASGLAVGAVLLGALPATLLADDTPAASPPGAASADAIVPVRGVDPPRVTRVVSRAERLHVITRVRVRSRGACGTPCRVGVTLRARSAGPSSRAVRRARRAPLAKTNVVVRPPVAARATLKLSRRASAGLVRTYGAGARAALEVELTLNARSGKATITSDVTFRLPGRARDRERVAGRLKRP